MKQRLSRELEEVELDCDLLLGTIAEFALKNQ